MVISSIRLRQSLSARIASSGLQSSFAVGGTLNPTLTPTNADIAYGFSIKSGHASNSVKWTLDAHTLQQTDANTAPTGTETIAAAAPVAAASILDVNGEAIPAAACAVAIYYETSVDSAWVMATANSAEFGTIKLIGTGETHEEQIGVRSALLVPRQDCTSKEVVFTFSTDGIQINVVYLANTTFT